MEMYLEFQEEKKKSIQKKESKHIKKLFTFYLGKNLLNHTLHPKVYAE